MSGTNTGGRGMPIIRSLQKPGQPSTVFGGVPGYVMQGGKDFTTAYATAVIYELAMPYRRARGGQAVGLASAECGPRQGGPLVCQSNARDCRANVARFRGSPTTTSRRQASGCPPAIGPGPLGLPERRRYGACVGTNLAPSRPPDNGTPGLHNCRHHQDRSARRVCRPCRGRGHDGRRPNSSFRPKTCRGIRASVPEGLKNRVEKLLATNSCRCRPYGLAGEDG